MLLNLTAPCNAHCRCLRSDFLPICGADEVQYFSPCYAGCTAVVPQKRGTKVWPLYVMKEDAHSTSNLSSEC